MVVNYTTLEQNTTQEVFDHIVKHLLTQKRVAMVPCVSGDILLSTNVTIRTAPNSCTMLSPEGFRCAAGCLFTPKQINELVNNETLDLDLQEEWWSWRSKLNLTNKHDDIIEAMQDVHDKAEFVDKDKLIEHWKKEFVKVANHFKLNTDICHDT